MIESHKLLIKTLVFATFSSSAASFDCSRAVYPIERLICSTPETSKADSELADSYKRALSIVGEPLKENQREWLKERNRAASRDELLQLYTQRIDYLKKLEAENHLPFIKRDGSRNIKIEADYKKYLSDSIESREDCLANTIGVLGICETVLNDMKNFKKSHQNEQQYSPLLFKDLTAKIDATQKKINELKDADKDNALYEQMKEKCNQPVSDIASKEDEATILTCVRESFNSNTNNDNPAMTLYKAFKDSGRSTSKFDMDFLGEYNKNLKVILDKLNHTISNDMDENSKKYSHYAPQKRNIILTSQLDDGYAGVINDGTGLGECILLKGYPFTLDRKGMYSIWSFISDEKAEIMNNSGDIKQCNVLIFSPDKPEYINMFKGTKTYKEYIEFEKKAKEGMQLYDEGMNVVNKNNIEKSKDIYNRATKLLQNK